MAAQIADRLTVQELEIRRLSDEIGRLLDLGTQGTVQENPSPELEQLRAENEKLKYRIAHLQRSLQEEQERAGPDGEQAGEQTTGEQTTGEQTTGEACPDNGEKSLKQQAASLNKKNEKKASKESEGQKQEGSEQSILVEDKAILLTGNSKISTTRDNIETQSTSTPEYDVEMASLLRELDQKFGRNSNNLQCFPTNPLKSEHTKFIVFETQDNEDRVGRVDWCLCENCIAMPTGRESICCREIENAKPYLKNINCITAHEHFKTFCQHEEIVSILLRAIGQLRYPPPRKQMNRLRRKTAYRAFSAWVHGFLSAGKQRPIPSCAVKLVRSAFPDQDMGSKVRRDYAAEFMAYE